MYASAIGVGPPLLDSGRGRGIAAATRVHPRTGQGIARFVEGALVVSGRTLLSGPDLEVGTRLGLPVDAGFVGVLVHKCFSFRGVVGEVSLCRLALGDRLRDDPVDLFGDAEVRGETVLGQRER